MQVHPKIARFLLAWSDLLQRPTAFIHRPIDEKRSAYPPAWEFYVLTTTVLGAYSLGLQFWFAWSQDSEAPLPGLSLSSFIPGQVALYTQVAQLALEWSFLFFVVHKLFGAKSRLSTTSLPKRLFVELLYFEGGPASVAPCIVTLLYAPLAYALAVLVFAPTTGVLKDDSGFASSIWMIGILLLLFLFLALPITVIAGYYYVFTRAVFHIRWQGAFATAACFSVIVPTIFVGFGLLTKAVHSETLPFEDQHVIAYIKAVARVEMVYEQRKHAYCDLKELMAFASSVNELEAALGEFSDELTLLRKTSPDALSHSLLFQLTKRGGYLHAIPKTPESGARSYVVSFKQPKLVWTCACQGRRATLLDDVVTPFW